MMFSVKKGTINSGTEYTRLSAGDLSVTIYYKTHEIFLSICKSTAAHMRFDQINAVIDCLNAEINGLQLDITRYRIKKYDESIGYCYADTGSKILTIRHTTNTFYIFYGGNIHIHYLNDVLNILTKLRTMLKRNGVPL